MQERKFISIIYLDKLQSSLLYREAGRSLKEFSDAVYERFSEFSAQDMVHAVALHGMMGALAAKHPDLSAEILITPDIIDQVGAKRQEDEETDYFGMARMWIGKFRIVEDRICKLVGEIENESQNLLDFSREFISLTGLRVISEDRLSALRDLENKIRSEKCQLFNRSDENQLWKCLNCGMSSVGPEAPQECPCCLAPQGTQAAGDWRVA